MRTHRRTRAPPHQRRRRADGNASQEEERTRQRLRCRNAKYVIIPHKDRRRIGSHFFFINPAGEQVGRMPPPPLLSSHAYKKSFNYTLILSLSLSLSLPRSLSPSLSLSLSDHSHSRCLDLSSPHSLISPPFFPATSFPISHVLPQPPAPPSSSLPPPATPSLLSSTPRLLSLPPSHSPPPPPTIYISIDRSGPQRPARFRPRRPRLVPSQHLRRRSLPAGRPRLRRRRRQNLRLRRRIHGPVPVLRLRLPTLLLPRFHLLPPTPLFQTPAPSRPPPPLPSPRYPARAHVITLTLALSFFAVIRPCHRPSLPARPVSASLRVLGTPHARPWHSTRVPLMVRG